MNTDVLNALSWSVSQRLSIAGVVGNPSRVTKMMCKECDHSEISLRWEALEEFYSTSEAYPKRYCRLLDIFVNPHEQAPCARGSSTKVKTDG